MPEEVLQHCTSHGYKRPCLRCVYLDKLDGRYDLEKIKNYLRDEMLK